MAVEYDIASDVAVIKEVGSVSKCARIAQTYSGTITYDDEASSKFATVTIDGKSQRVMLCIKVSGTVVYDDVPSLYSTVDGHRCLNITVPSGTEIADDAPSFHETVVVDGKTVRAVRCVMINKTPTYDGVSSVCTFVDDNGKTHTAQLVNQITGGSVEVIIKGTSPLVLPDAIANSLSYVKAFGGIEQNGTPTPDTPMNIVSNNGVLKACHASGLPLGYTLLDYIQSSGTQYIDTGYTMTSDVVEYGIKIYGQPSGASSLFGSQTSSSPLYTGVPYTYASGSSHAGETHVFIGSASNLVSNTFPQNQWNTYTLQTTSANAGSVTLNGTTQTFSYTFGIQKSRQIWLFGNNNVSTSKQLLTAKVASFYIKDNGLLVRNFIPAKNSSNVIGMYDLVSGQFFTNAGTGDFVAGETVDDIEVYADGTVETINVHGKNLFDKATMGTKYLVNLYTNNSLSIGGTNAGFIIPVMPNTQYTLSTSTALTIFRIATYYKQITAADGTVTSNNYVKQANNNPITFTTTDTDRFLYVQVNTALFDDVLNTLQLERGSTATEYAPYYNGGTAMAEMLLKVGDYQDVQEILAGDVTRKVGVKVLDGTENFETATATNCYSLTNTLGTGNFANRTIACSHFASTPTLPSTSARQGLAFITNKGPEYTIAFGATTQFSTQALWKQWLADQYAAGTPVIVIYPLATPTTESITGQTLQVTDGDNTLEITQASLTGLELEAQYNAAVSLTIQEVQDANLDNNVTVTIQ